MKVIKQTYGPFSVNTYVLVDEVSNEVIIIDPGMYDSQERNAFLELVSIEKWKPTLLLNTHCHIDHVMGNKFIHDQFGLTPQIHEKAAQVLERASLSAQMYGLNYDPSPEGEVSLTHNDELIFKGNKFQVLFTPGHSPGHVVFYNQKEKYVINGDVLFQGSVGRTDLPGCSASDLVRSIQNIMYKLPNETLVYTGHGPETTIGHEKLTNHFVTASESRLN
ncbi:MAG: MBL fold metallo-hydrolase [Flavobacteriales bacterium]